MQRRILIVEDDPLTALTYRCALKGHGESYACHYESTGEGALAHLRRESPDAAILDWDLPGISGLEVLRAIRSDSGLGGLPVLMVTGRCDEASRDLALTCGANQFRNKPLAPAELLGRLRELLS